MALNFEDMAGERSNVTFSGLSVRARVLRYTHAIASQS